jgi:hypothetical protein
MTPPKRHGQEGRQRVMLNPKERSLQWDAVKPKKQGSAGDALVAQVESKRVIGK